MEGKGWGEFRTLAAVVQVADTEAALVLEDGVAEEGEVVAAAAVDVVAASAAAVH